MIHGGCITLCGLFLYIDYITQLGYAAGTPYVVVVALAMLVGARHIVLFYAGLSTVLILLGFYVSVISEVYTIAIMNRVISVAIIWIVALIFIRYLNSKEIFEAWQNARIIFDATPAPLVMVDSEGVIELINQSCCELFGYDQDALIGQHIEILIPAKFKQQHQRYRAAYNQNPERRMMAARKALYALTRDGQELPVEIGLNPVKLDSGSKVVASVVDMSESMEKLDILQKHAEELKKSNKYLEEFAYVASHDLQEPLRMVSSYTQLLANRYQDKLDQDANEFINYAVDGAKRMQALIQDLLMFSRLSTQPRQNEPVDANALYQYALANLSMLIEESGSIVSTDALPMVSGDTGQLRQLFQNIIGNAVKYREPTRTNQVHVSAQRVNDRWQFCIKDNGIGIQSEYFERVFVIFKRLHVTSQYPGTGIGLALCQRIVETHGGELWVESEYGKGSCFYFTLAAVE